MKYDLKLVYGQYNQLCSAGKVLGVVLPFLPLLRGPADSVAYIT